METQTLINNLSQFVTNHRYNLIRNILPFRTRYLTVVLEDIYQPHNASAVLRSCDCFGIQDVHIIENLNQYTVNPDVSLGSSKWLTLHRHNSSSHNTASALQQLKTQGYRIVATTPHTEGSQLEDFNLHAGKCAFCFGTEMEGLSSTALTYADEHLKIPLYGFTESLNLSVSAALIMHYLSHQLRQSTIDWQLSQEEQAELQLEWLKKSIKHADLLVKEFQKHHDKK